MFAIVYTSMCFINKSVCHIAYSARYSVCALQLYLMLVRPNILSSSFLLAATDLYKNKVTQIIVHCTTIDLEARSYSPLYSMARLA